MIIRTDQFQNICIKMVLSYVLYYCLSLFNMRIHAYLLGLGWYPSSGKYVGCINLHIYTITSSLRSVWACYTYFPRSWVISIIWLICGMSHIFIFVQLCLHYGKCGQVIPAFPRFWIISIIWSICRIGELYLRYVMLGKL